MKYKHRTLIEHFNDGLIDNPDVSPEFKMSLRRAFFKGAFIIIDLLIDAQDKVYTIQDIKAALVRYTAEIKGFSAGLETGQV